MLDISLIGRFYSSGLSSVILFKHLNDSDQICFHAERNNGQIEEKRIEQELLLNVTYAPEVATHF